MEEEILKIKGLKIHFPTDEGLVKAVDGIDIVVDEGETVGIVGESGCGKSVTALTVLGLLDLDHALREGQILFKNRNLFECTDKEMCEIRGKDISMIFQEPMTSLNPVFKIGAQIEESIRLHSQLGGHSLRQKAIELLKAVGIPRSESILREYPHQLSGGMRQRVMIAMAMACEPALIIADEPTTALDVTIQAQILDLLRKLQEGKKSSILFISHDLGVIAEMCDRVIVMYAGKVVEEGDVFTIFENPQHPYTIGLLKSIPNLMVNLERLDCIPGNVPIPRNMPAGCKFYERCQSKLEKCRMEEPPLISAENGHKIRCWRNFSED